MVVVPGPVSDFNAQAFSSYIFANWGEPAEKNGILLGYSIGAVKHGDKEPIKPVSQVQFVDLPIDKFEHLFKDMDPESRYVIYLQAKTKIGPGPVMKADVKTIAPASKYFASSSSENLPVWKTNNIKKSFQTNFNNFSSR